jgi:hypothetical protein
MAVQAAARSARIRAGEISACEKSMETTVATTPMKAKTGRITHSIPSSFSWFGMPKISELVK